jgi:hypothetical protein
MLIWAHLHALSEEAEVNSGWMLAGGRVGAQSSGLGFADTGLTWWLVYSCPSSLVWLRGAHDEQQACTSVRGAGAAWGGQYREVHCVVPHDRDPAWWEGGLLLGLRQDAGRQWWAACTLQCWAALAAAGLLTVWAMLQGGD